MDGITLDELRARHERCKAARTKLEQEYKEKDTGFAYVLGEIETLIALVEQKERARVAAELADAAALAELKGAAKIGMSEYIEVQE